MWDEEYDYYLEDIYDLRYEYHDYGEGCECICDDSFYDDWSDDDGNFEEM